LHGHGLPLFGLFVACADVHDVQFLCWGLMEYPGYLHGWCKLAEYLHYLIILLNRGEMYHLAEPLEDYLQFGHPLTDPYNIEMVVGPNDLVVLHELLDDLTRVQLYNYRLHGVYPGFPWPKQCICS